jgi:hypothetical protein
LAWCAIMRMNRRKHPVAGASQQFSIQIEPRGERGHAISTDVVSAAHAGKPAFILNQKK